MSCSTAEFIELSQQTKLVLARGLAQRSYDDVLLLKAFLHHTEFWKMKLTGASPIQVDDICRSLHLESFEDGSFIFQQGDPADKVYIILSGHVEGVCRN